MEDTNKTNIIIPIKERINSEKFDKLNNTEKDNYLIENQIYVRFNDVNNITGHFFKEKTYSLKLYKKINNLAYQINSEIIEDFLDFLFGDYANSKTEIDSLKFYYEQKLNTKDKIKFIKKEYKKSLKIIESKPEFRLLFGQEYEGAQTLQFHIIFHTNFTNILYSHICGLITMEALKLTRKWSKGIIAKNIMDFCKQELQKIEEKNKKTIGTKSKIEIEKPSKYPLVFTNLEKENLFKNYLKKINAIDKNNEPIKGVFQPACHAFFNNAKEMQNDKIIISEQIFQTGRNKNKFIAMLIKENYLSKNTTKLSDGKNYNNIAMNFINKSFEN